MTGTQPFPPAVQGAGLVYTSGLVCVDPVTLQPLSADFDGQCWYVLDQLDIVLRGHGSDRDHVLKLECFLSDRKYYTAWNAAFAEFFAVRAPARTTTITTLPAEGLLIEVQAVATHVEE